MGDRRGKQVKIGKEVSKEHPAALNEFKSPGLDGLHPRVLKELADVILETLNENLREVLEHRQTAKGLEKSRCGSCLQKGEGEVDPGNYRPFSLTSICGEILEKNNQATDL